jgi:hypothetical protein
LYWHSSASNFRQELMRFFYLAIIRLQSIRFYECIGCPRISFDMVEMLGGEVGWGSDDGLRGTRIMMSPPREVGCEAPPPSLPVKSSRPNTHSLLLPPPPPLQQHPSTTQLTTTITPLHSLSHHFRPRPQPRPTPSTGGRHSTARRPHNSRQTV